MIYELPFSFYSFLPCFVLCHFPPTFLLFLLLLPLQLPQLGAVCCPGLKPVNWWWWMAVTLMVAACAKFNYTNGDYVTNNVTLFLYFFSFSDTSSLLPGIITVFVTLLQHLYTDTFVILFQLVPEGDGCGWTSLTTKECLFLLKKYYEQG